MFSDAHVHLDHPAYDTDRDEVVARARAVGVSRFTLIGSDPDRWTMSLDLGRALGQPVACGLHPWDASTLDAPECDALLQRLAGLPVTAIGEFGLDALHARTDAQRLAQRALVRAQLALARQRHLPVVLHAVRALPELLDLMTRDGAVVGGVVHAWGGPPDQIARATSMGLQLSFGPAVLRNRAVKARASAVAVPLDHLLVESDGPDMAPPGRGRGEMADVPEVLRAVAALRNTPVEDLRRAVQQNARRAFGRVAS